MYFEGSRINMRFCSGMLAKGSASQRNGGVGGTRIRQRIPSWYFVYLLFTLELNARSKVASAVDKSESLTPPKLTLSGRPYG